MKLDRLAALVAGLLAVLPAATSVAADRSAAIPLRAGRFPFVDATEPGPPAPAPAPGEDLLAIAPSRRVAAAVTSVGSGDWDEPTIWSSGAVPTLADDVTIADGTTVTIDASASCASLTVGQGTSGTLRFEALAARTLSVAGDVLVSAGGTLESAATGTQSGHTLVLGGSLTNDGTLDFSTSGNAAGARILFSGTGHATFGGSGGTTDIRTITVNRVSGSLVTLEPLNFTVRGATDNPTAANGMLVLVSGTLRLGGTFAGTNTLSTAASWTIPASAGLWLQNPNYTIAGMNGTINVSGQLMMDGGTFNVGNTSGNRLGYTAGAGITIHGGTINVAGRLSPTSNPVTYTQSGGTVRLTTVGNPSTTNAAFDVQSGSTFTMSGGTIVLERAGTSGAGPRDYRNFASTVSISGGTLQVGSATSGAAQTFRLQGVAPALVVTSTSGNHVARLRNELDVRGNTTIEAGAALALDGFPLVQLGQEVENDGAIDGGAPGSRLAFAAATPQAYGGTGTVGTASSPLAALDLDNGSTLTLSSLAPRIIAARANLFRGTLVNSDRLQLGAGGTSAAATQIGVTANATLGGSYDVAPTFDVGTGGYSMFYEGETAVRTTGVELPGSRAVVFLEVNNTHDVVLAGGDLAVGTALTFPAGSRNLATGDHTLTLLAGASVFRPDEATSGYVVGNLAVDVSLDNPTRHFAIGDSAHYAPVILGLEGVTTGGTLTARTDPFDLTEPGSGLDPAKLVHRHWTLFASPGLAFASALGEFHFVSGDVAGGASPANFAVRKLDGATWSKATAGVRNATSTQATWSSGMSRFAIGELSRYALNVATVGNGAVARSPDEALYDHGSSVELTATPAPGWHFVSWSGDTTSTANPLTVVVEAERNLTATFAINTYVLDVAIVGDGAVARNPDQAAYDHGSTVELTATPGSGSYFVSWTGDASGTANPLTVLMDADKHLTARFTDTTYVVNASTVGNGTVARDPDLPFYPSGTSVVLTATPAAGWHFVSWSGDAAGSANPLTVLADADRNIVATFAIDTRPLDVEVTGNGTVARNPDQASYDLGSTVELTAIPAPEWHFVSWGGDASGSANPLAVVVDSALSITATFAIDTHSLTVATVGSGTVAKSPDQVAYDSGSIVLLTATPAPGWHFVSWSGDGSGTLDTLSVVLNADKNVTATFALNRYAVNVTTVGDGTVARDPDLALYDHGTPVELTATPAAHWHFVSWSGDASGTANPLTVLVESEKNITATFALDAYAVNVAIVGEGSVARSPDQAVYPHGSAVELTATPEVGWHFDSWSGDASGSANPLTVTVEAEQNLVATFAIDTYALHDSTVGNGTIARNPDQPFYDHGSTVELTATPEAGWHFVSWEGDASGSVNPLTVLIDSEKSIIATFELTDVTVPTAHLDAPNTSAEVMTIGTDQLVQWTAADDFAVTSVDLLLSRDGAAGPFTPIALGIANSGSYLWTVTGPATASGVLRVIAHDAAANEGADDSDEPLQVIENLVAAEPAEIDFALLPVVPSPSVSQARLFYDLPRAADVRLGIVDVRGREVASLVHGEMPAGRHLAVWNGETPSGHAPPGIYFARYLAGGKRFTRRIVLL